MQRSVNSQTNTKQPNFRVIIYELINPLNTGISTGIQENMQHTQVSMTNEMKIMYQKSHFAIYGD